MDKTLYGIDSKIQKLMGFKHFNYLSLYLLKFVNNIINYIYYSQQIIR